MTPVETESAADGVPTAVLSLMYPDRKHRQSLSPQVDVEESNISVFVVLSTIVIKYATTQGVCLPIT